MKCLPLLLSLFLAILGCLSVNTVSSPENTGAMMQLIAAEGPAAGDEGTITAGGPEAQKTASPEENTPRGSVLSKAVSRKR